MLVAICAFVLASGGFILLRGRKLWKTYFAKDRETRRFVIKALLIYVVVAAIAQLPLLWASDFGSARSLVVVLTTALTSPLQILQAAIPIFVALWLVWRVKPLHVGETRDVSDPLKTAPIDETVKQVFRSEEFLTALRTSLPKGKGDDKHGLDYIPFMLDALQNKRRRFDRRANVFFLVTVGVGLTFAGIISYLGYALVNERAIGLPRDVADLREDVKDIRALLGKVDTALVYDWPIRDAVYSFGRDLQKFRLGDKNKALVQEISQAAQDWKHTRQIDEMLTTLEKAQDKVDPSAVEGRALIDLFNKGRTEFQKVRDIAESVAPQIKEQANRTDEALRKVEQFNNKDENRLAELAKRLSIGLVIATFFFWDSTICRRPISRKLGAGCAR